MYLRKVGCALPLRVNSMDVCKGRVLLSEWRTALLGAFERADPAEVASCAPEWKQRHAGILAEFASRQQAPAPWEAWGAGAG